MKKKVILVTNKTDYPPIGPLYIADALEQAGFEVFICGSSESNTDFLKLVLEVNPLFVGFSAFTWPTISDMVDKSKLIKRNFSSIPVVWGALHPTFMADPCLVEEYIDYIILGEGEVSIVEFAKDLAENSNLLDKCYGGWNLLPDLDNFKPAWHLINLRDFIFDSSHSVRGDTNSSSKASRIFYYLVTSRGCLYDCTFCYNSVRPKKPWRGHSFDWVKEQVLFLKREVNIDCVGFWDDLFFGDRERAIKIVEFLAENNIKFLCEDRADRLDDNFAKWLKDKGCLQIFIGAESGSDRVLRLMRKRITAADIRRAAEITNRYRLPARFAFIYGFPGEAFEDMLQTKRLIEEISRYPNVSISGPKLYTPVPGAQSYNVALQFGFPEPSTTEEWKNIHRSSDLKYLPWFEKELQKNKVNPSFLFA